MNKNIIIGLIAVLILGALFFFSSNRSAPESQVQNNLPAGFLPYESNELGISFAYPESHEPVLNNVGADEEKSPALILLPKGYVPPVNGEGPPAVWMEVFYNPEKLTLEEWMTRFGPPKDQLTQTGGVTETTVAGQPALSFRESGLYEIDTVLVLNDGKIYYFSVGWLTAEDQLRKDFQELLQTVRFL